MEKIVPVDPQDIPQILKIIKKEFPYKSFEIENFHGRVLQPSVFVFKITLEKELGGFIDIEFLNEETGRITAVSVLEKFRGKQLGKKLVEFAIDFFRKQAVKKIVLLVAQDNETAKKLYLEAGFAKTKTLENKIGSKTVEEMELELGDNAHED